MAKKVKITLKTLSKADGGLTLFIQKSNRTWAIPINYEDLFEFRRSFGGAIVTEIENPAT